MRKQILYQYYVEGEDESCSNLSARLLRCGFEKTKLWSRMPGNRFLEFGNDAAKIKK